MSRRNETTYFPSWLPIDTPPWRLVDGKTGDSLKDKDGKSLAFVTDTAAIAYAKRKKLPLAPGVDKAAETG